MPLYYITGIAGSGKSTVLSALQDRGYEAYDVDMAGPVTAKWHNDSTGYVHPKSSVKQADRTPEFIASHSWKVSRDDVVSLAQTAGQKPVFIGGAIANEAEIMDLFETSFALVIDDDILVYRLQTRAEGNWGKTAHELEHSRQINKLSAERYARSDHIVIDAGQQIDNVVAEILDHTANDVI